MAQAHHRLEARNYLAPPPPRRGRPFGPPAARRSRRHRAVGRKQPGGSSAACGCAGPGFPVVLPLLDTPKICALPHINRGTSPPAPRPGAAARLFDRAGSLSLLGARLSRFYFWGIFCWPLLKPPPRPLLCSCRGKGASGGPPGFFVITLRDNISMDDLFGSVYRAGSAEPGAFQLA